MKLGFSPVSAAMLDLDAAFKLATELELDFVELSFDLHEAIPDMQSVEQVRELSSATGVGSTLHLSYIDLNLASVIPAARRVAVDRTLRGLEFGDAVGSMCGVLHTGFNRIPFEQARMLALASLQESLSELEGSSVPVALENLVLTEADVVRDSGELAEITRRHGMGNCFDVGHANVEGQVKGEDLIPRYVESMGQNLIHLHLHNNHAQEDEHLPTDQGTIDYARLKELFSGFEGTACLEISTGVAGVRAAVAHLRDLGLVPA